MLATTPIGLRQDTFYDSVPKELLLELLYVSLLERHVGLEPTTFSMARRYATNCINAALAEGAGLEPTRGLCPRRFSRPLPYQLG